MSLRTSTITLWFLFSFYCVLYYEMSISKISLLDEDDDLTSFGARSLFAATRDRAFSSSSSSMAEVVDLTQDDDDDDDDAKSKLCCDRCAGEHETRACPFSKQPREPHVDDGGDKKLCSIFAPPKKTKSPLNPHFYSMFNVRKSANDNEDDDGGVTTKKSNQSLTTHAKKLSSGGGACDRVVGSSASCQTVQDDEMTAAPAMKSNKEVSINNRPVGVGGGGGVATLNVQGVIEIDDEEEAPAIKSKNDGGDKKLCSIFATPQKKNKESFESPFL
jgi:hypothetical protein